MLNTKTKEFRDPNIVKEVLKPLKIKNKRNLIQRHEQLLIKFKFKSGTFKLTNFIQGHFRNKNVQK